MILVKEIQRICSFLLNMAFISSSAVENIYMSCENIKYALYYIFSCISLLCISDSNDTLPTLVVGGNVGVGIPTLDQHRTNATMSTTLTQNENFTLYFS